MTSLITTEETLELGSGFVFFKRATTPANDSFRYLGDCPGLTVNIETEKAEHFKSTVPGRVKDKSKVISTNRTGTMTLDSITSENLAMLFFGESSPQTVVAKTSAGTADSFTVNKNSLVQLGVTTANPGGAWNVTVTSVKNENETTTYTEGDDYTVDAKRGVIFIPPNSDIGDGSVIKVLWTATNGTRERVLSGGDTVSGALCFEENRGEGNDKKILMPSVELSPGGDFNLIAADTFRQMSFNLDVLSPASGEAIQVYKNS